MLPGRFFDLLNVPLGSEDRIQEPHNKTDRSPVDEQHLEPSNTSHGELIIHLSEAGRQPHDQAVFAGYRIAAFRLSRNSN